MPSMDITMHEPAFLDSREFARMTRAIEFIEREYQRQPRLAQIAREIEFAGREGQAEGLVERADSARQAYEATVEAITAAGLRG